MEIIELTVTSSIHLIRSNLSDLKTLSVGSGIIIKYKERYFIGTVPIFQTSNVLTECLTRQVNDHNK